MISPPPYDHRNCVFGGSREPWNFDLWDGACREHGGLSHAVVHEAAHAVVAVQYGIEFDDVSINPDPVLHPHEVGGMTGGGVRFASAEALLVRVGTEIEAGYKFCSAGVIAERLAFRHVLRDAEIADVAVWRRAAGLIDAQERPAERIAAVVGRAHEELYLEANQEIVALYPAIKRVADALGDPPARTLRFDEVAAIVSESASSAGRLPSRT